MAVLHICKYRVKLGERDPFKLIQSLNFSTLYESHQVTSKQRVAILYHKVPEPLVITWLGWS